MVFDRRADLGGRIPSEGLSRVAMTNTTSQIYLPTNRKRRRKEKRAKRREREKSALVCVDSPCVGNLSPFCLHLGSSYPGRGSLPRKLESSTVLYCVLYSTVSMYCLVLTYSQYFTVPCSSFQHTHPHPTEQSPSQSNNGSRPRPQIQAIYFQHSTAQHLHPAPDPRHRTGTQNRQMLPDLEPCLARSDGETPPPLPSFFPSSERTSPLPAEPGCSARGIPGPADSHMDQVFSKTAQSRHPGETGGDSYRRYVL